MAIRTVNTGGFDLLYGFFLHALIPVSFKFECVLLHVYIISRSLSECNVRSPAGTTVEICFYLVATR